MQLTIGSQRLCNKDGVINISGCRKTCLEWGPVNSELLLTMDLYGAGGAHIARLRRNQGHQVELTKVDWSAACLGHAMATEATATP